MYVELRSAVGTPLRQVVKTETTISIPCTPPPAHMLSAPLYKYIAVAALSRHAGKATSISEFGLLGSSVSQCMYANRGRGTVVVGTS